MDKVTDDFSLGSYLSEALADKVTDDQFLNNHWFDEVGLTCRLQGWTEPGYGRFSAHVRPAANVHIPGVGHVMSSHSHCFCFCFQREDEKIKIENSRLKNSVNI